MLKLGGAATAGAGIDGVDLPGTGRLAINGPVTALWRGPQEWLLLTDEPRALLASLERSTGGSADISDSLLLLGIDGPGRADVVAQGTGVNRDLITEGRCARVRFAGLRVDLFAGPDAVTLIVDRAFGRYLVAWFRQAAESGRA